MYRNLLRIDSPLGTTAYGNIRSVIPYIVERDYQAAHREYGNRSSFAKVLSDGSADRVLPLHVYSSSVSSSKISRSWSIAGIGDG
jgi:hypothetical protein